MNIILITFVTPASENIRGTSALPYHMIKGGSPTPSLLEGEGDIAHNFSIYTFNNNALSDEKIKEVEKELNVSIKTIPLPKWYLWMMKLHLLFLRIFLEYPFLNYIKLPQKYVEDIKSQNPDLIWVYGEELSRVVRQFPNTKRIQLGPDTESLYYYRMLGQRFVMKNPIDYWKCALMYRKYARMERDFCTDANFTYYAVGEEDVKFLKNLNPKVNAKFLRHPHYEVRDNVNFNFNKGLRHENERDNFNVNFNFNKDISQENENGTHTDNKSISKKFHSPKIKLLIAGQYNLYMKQEADLLIEQISANDNVNENRLPLAPSNLEGELRNENENSNFNVNLNFNEGDDYNDKSKNINPRNLCNPCEIPENTKTQSTSEAPIVHSSQLKKNYTITFLGKGWEKHVEDLRKAGFEVNHIKFAPDYIEEICKHDIQITPIAIGTGTKGKVLDALANGLLVIGTTYALENIAVKHDESCIEYHYPTEVIDILNDIPNNLDKYERMAEAGRQAVLKYHNRRKISSELFGG